jgi:hypothetical protein
MAEYDITNDTELRAAVRTETQYDDARLSTEDLKGLVDSAKRVLALRAEATDFYGDRGLSVALLGVVCAKAKGAVENSPVRVKNISQDDVTFRTSDGSSLQVGQYETMVQVGLSNSEVAQDDSVQGLELTNTYFSGSPSRTDQYHR